MTFVPGVGYKEPRQVVADEKNARERAREFMRDQADIVPGTVVVGPDGQVHVWGVGQWEPFLDDQGQPVHQRSMVVDPPSVTEWLNDGVVGEEPPPRFHFEGF